MVPKTKLVGTPNINNKLIRQYSNENGLLDSDKP